MTRKFAVVGSPIEHSKSPEIHRAILKSLGKNDEYSRFDVSDLEPFLANHQELDGLSVTMPLKEQALEVSAWVDSVAKLAKSVNTLVKDADGWRGYNTDVFGIKCSLKSIPAGNATVIGTGATARSAVIALRELGFTQMIWGRNELSAKEIAQEYGIAHTTNLSDACKSEVVVLTLPPKAFDELIPKNLEPTGVLLDVAYDPWPSKAAEAWNIRGEAISGIEMLIWQAIAQQRIFQGGTPESEFEDENSIYRAVISSLQMAK